jgi:hypothetical protein
MALDEVTVRCKARSKAVSYIPSKPDKWGIRLYAVCAWDHHYIFSFWDNGTGNTTGEDPARNYAFKHNIRHVQEAMVTRKLLPANNTARPLWALMQAHMCVQDDVAPTTENTRLVVTDNYYTSPVLAKAAQALSQGNVLSLGTVKLTNQSKENQDQIKKGTRLLETAPKGTWVLLQVFEKVPGHGTGANRIPASIQVQEKAGFICFKDRGSVVFYCNDLAYTPPSDVNYADDPVTIDCVRGLAPLPRWTGTEIIRRSVIMVPAPIVAYINFMNAVDKVDQVRSSTALLRRERRVSMSLFSWVLDAAIINTFAVVQILDPDTTNLKNIHDLKLQLIQALVKPWVDLKPVPSAVDLAMPPTATTSQRNLLASVGVLDSEHVLLELVGGKRARCHLCYLLYNTERKVTDGCHGCKKAFHVNCFALFHYAGGFNGNAPRSVTSNPCLAGILKVLQNIGTDGQRKYRRERPVLSTQGLEHITPPPAPPTHHADDSNKRKRSDDCVEL